MHFSAIPAWLQITWAIMGGIILPCAGIGWVIYFVKGYLKPMKEMQEKALSLASNSIGTVDEIQKAVRPLIEKADMILVEIKPIVEKANGATDDVTQVAHKVREGIDQLNGSLNFSEIRDELKGVSDSLKSISGLAKGFNIGGIFGGRKNG